MNLRNLKLTVGIISVISIVGMILSAVLNHLGGVIGFGSISAVAILTMMASSTVVAHEVRPVLTAQTPTIEDEARNLEISIASLVEKGTDEGELRSLISAALRYSKQN